MKSKTPFLKGKPASAGKARGRVKILFPRDDISSFNRGDILVTDMTDPSMVLVMTMAAAIVTDVGGVTAHAAILSRELGIPCVVATISGTTTLKDGDLIEVDGHTGHVHLIENA